MSRHTAARKSVPRSILAPADIDDPVINALRRWGAFAESVSALDVNGLAELAACLNPSDAVLLVIAQARGRRRAA